MIVKVGLSFPEIEENIRNSKSEFILGYLLPLLFTDPEEKDDFQSFSDDFVQFQLEYVGVGKKLQAKKNKLIIK